MLSPRPLTSASLVQFLASPRLTANDRCGIYSCPAILHPGPTPPPWPCIQPPLPCVQSDSRTGSSRAKGRARAQAPGAARWDARLFRISPPRIVVPLLLLNLNGFPQQMAHYAAIWKRPERPSPSQAQGEGAYADIRDRACANAVSTGQAFKSTTYSPRWNSFSALAAARHVPRASPPRPIRAHPGPRPRPCPGPLPGNTLRKDEAPRRISPRPAPPRAGFGSRIAGKNLEHGEAA